MADHDEDLDFAIALSLQEDPFDTNSKVTEEDFDIKIIEDGTTLEPKSNPVVDTEDSLDYAIALSLEETPSSSVTSNLWNVENPVSDIKIIEDDITLKPKSNPVFDNEESLDYAIALSLEAPSSLETSDLLSVENPMSWDSSKIVDSSWELVDPHPNIHDLFVKFDAMFFKCALTNGGVAVNWSTRMTLCAGVCCYEGRGGMCTIKLSEPLLKLRPRKDLVETLLHEMIHALLFVTANNKDRDGHGTEFQKQMHRINAATGANITIYHSFHNEVKLYQQHWWKCDGPCQKKSPFYGIVRRAMNRPPSPNDIWWAKHAATCGGTYTKIKEPDGYSDKGKRKMKEDKTVSAGKGSKNIVDFFKKTGSSSSGYHDDSSGCGQPAKIVKGIIVPNGKQQGSSSNPYIPVCRTNDSENMRLKMLSAIEQRHNTKRPSHVKKTINSSSKRAKINCEDDVVIVDSTPPPSTVVIATNKTKLTWAAKPSNSSVSNKSKATPTTKPAISVTKCPVCGRTDIPSVVYEAHFQYCLEELESVV